MSGWAPTGYGRPWPSSDARAGAADAPATVGHRPRWRVGLTRRQSADYGASEDGKWDVPVPLFLPFSCGGVCVPCGAGGLRPPARGLYGSRWGRPAIRERPPNLVNAAPINPAVNPLTASAKRIAEAAPITGVHGTPKSRWTASKQTYRTPASHPVRNATTAQGRSILVRSAMVVVLHHRALEAPPPDVARRAAVEGVVQQPVGDGAERSGHEARLSSPQPPSSEK